MHDLGGELLCQLTERPVIKVRILGRSEMPECESHTAVFATGNNVAFKGDMVRRGLVCNLETLVERPELREFKKDALDHAASHRATYVAAVLTIIRAYLAAGAPQVCGPFGSYTAWSRMVRSPLVWLGEPDPITSMDAARGEDSVLTEIRELFGFWIDYSLGLLVAVHQLPDHRDRLHAHGRRQRTGPQSSGLRGVFAARGGRQEWKNLAHAVGAVVAQDQRARRQTGIAWNTVMTSTSAQRSSSRRDGLQDCRS